jgi:hypothetical protein
MENYSGGLPHVKKKFLKKTSRQAGRQAGRQTEKGTSLPVFHNDSNYKNTTKHHCIKNKCNYKKRGKT